MSDVPVLEGELLDSPSDSFRPVPEAFRNTGPAPIQPYTPQPQGGLTGGQPVAPVDGFGNSNPYAYTRDPNVPNYVGVPDRDWTPEVDDLNRSIADDINADPGLLDHLGGRRGGGRAALGNLAREGLEDGAIGLLGAASDYLGIPTDPADIARLGSGLIGDTAAGIAGLLGVNPQSPQQGYGPPPFEGGQSNVDYIVTWRIQNFQNVNQVRRTIRGPIQGPSIEFTQQGPCTKFGRPANRYQLRTRIYARGSVAYDNLNYSGNCFRDSEFAAQQENIYTISFTVVRADGQPDTGGDPLGDPVPTGRPGQGEGEPDFSNPNQPGVPGIGLPNPSVPNLPSIGNPFGDSPITGDGFDGIDAPNPLLPGVPGFPGFDPDGESGDDTSGDGDGSDPTGEPGENLTCCEKIDAIHNYFQKSGSEQYDAAPCDDGPLYDAWEGTGLVGLYRAVESLTRAVGLIWERLRCMESGAVAIPEWWAVRPGADVPQLAISLRAVQGESRWSFTIPHYNKGQDFRPQLPQFTKGSYFSTLTLVDNTKLVINANSFEEGERVINALIPLIDPAYLPPGNGIHQGRRRGQGLTVAEVKPTKAAFYSTGQKTSKPDYFVDFTVI